jgi:hypothetical protein
MTNNNVNLYEVTARDIGAVADLLHPFDPVATNLYAYLFIQRNESSSQLRIPLKRFGLPDILYQFES